METSSFTAFMTGINTFVFIIALTIAITLLSNVTKMSDAANEIVKSTDKGGLYETMYELDNKDKIINGIDLLKYNKKQQTATVNTNNYEIQEEEINVTNGDPIATSDITQYNFLVKELSITQDINTYINEKTITYLKSHKYKMTITEEINQYVVLFEKI